MARGSNIQKAMPQPGSRPASAVRALARRCPAAGPALLHLRAPGLSLPRAGIATQALSPGRRRQSVLQGQAFAQSRRPTPCLRRFDRIDLKRDWQPCLLGSAASRGRSWLTGRLVSHELCLWNIASIDCYRRSWLKPTNCSRQTGAGRSLQAGSPQVCQEVLNEQTGRSLRTRIARSARYQRPCENFVSTLPQTALRQHFFQDAVGDSVPARRTRLLPS